MKIIFYIVILLLSISLTAQNAMKSTQDKNGNTYQYAEGDSLGVRIYTLENGLKVYLAQQNDEPRIQTFIPVRTGSANDPKDNTGLAHYLEHMLFKGTSKIGTSNWEKEKALLEQISELFEQHKAEKEPTKKKEIYKKIDELSFQASKYAIANEYDKLITSIGGKGTNAYTWLDETVYINNIPSNEFEKWLLIESERFKDLVLRLFHTELETVYEEFNRAQDNDARLVQNELMDALFPTHPYGQQTTLGLAEHLKNPSMKAIHKYFSTYYVPNNMAIVLVGDLQFEPTIELIKKYFSSYIKKEIPENKLLKETKITNIIERKIATPSAENLTFAYRSEVNNPKNLLMLELIDMLLYNGKAGLMDLNIIKKQTALRVSSSVSIHNEYAFHRLAGVPKEGQSLEELKKLLLDEIEKIKKGEFDDWLISAAINDLELHKIKESENAEGLASRLVESFIRNQSWSENVNYFSEMRKITKDDVVKFANEFYQNNYVIIYKTKGENKHLIKVENPKITPVEINRQASSKFYDEFVKIPAGEITPQFLDFNKEIQHQKVKNIPFYIVPNQKNELASLHYILRQGSDHDRKLTLALNFLKYLGTKDKSAEELAKEFYRLGVSFSVKTFPSKSILSVTGLSKNLNKGIELFEHLIKNVIPNEPAYDEYVETILKSRNDAKINKASIGNALQNYAMFGKVNRVNDVMKKEDLQKITSKELVDYIKSIFEFTHELFYYGKDEKKISSTVLKHHQFKTNYKEIQPKIYEENPTSNQIYLAHYDMVQAEIGLYSRNQKYDKHLLPSSSLLNEYFGAGLSSIVFQEIRESKSLAYSAYCFFRNASEKDKFNYTQAYLGTQINKIHEAVDALQNLMKKLPKSDAQFDNAKSTVLKNLASERTTKENIFWNYDNLKAKGIDYDVKKEIYEKVQTITFDEMNQFFNQNINKKDYNYSILSNLKSLDKKALENLGTIKEVSLEELFGY